MPAVTPLLDSSCREPVFFARLDECVCYSETLVGHSNRCFPILFYTCQGSNRVHVLWDHNTLVMYLVDHIQLSIHNIQYVFPVDDFPHVRTRASQVTHNL